jgi:phage-related protein
MRNTRPISWIKAARKDFQKFPKEAQEIVLDALTIAAEGAKSSLTKPFKGMGSGVFEIALPFKGDAYRTIYAVQLGEAIWVIHAFQKKSPKGIKTPQQEVEVIKARLKRLKEELSWKNNLNWYKVAVMCTAILAM